MRADRVVIAGAGLAGLRTAEALRDRGFDGSIMLAGAEDSAPYDRPPLSKDVLTGKRDAAATVYRSAQHFTDLQIDLRLGHPVRELDLRTQTVRVGPDPVRFDRLVVATGSRPRELLPGCDLAGIHLLRTMDDAIQIRDQFFLGPRVVIAGAGFIGAEVASSARALGLAVTIVEAAPTPLARAVGSRLGGVNARLHRDNGTALICNTGIAGCYGNGRVEAVRLTNGQHIDCDLLVVGIGATPNVEWLSGSGLRLDNGLVCDERLNTGHPAVFGAGDVARWPNQLFGLSMRAEQWTNAAEQGRRVAANALEPAQAQPFLGSNYFWSDQYGVRIQFAGVSDADDVHVVRGSEDSYQFVAHYGMRGRLVGAFAMNSPRQLVQSKLLIEGRATLDAANAALS